MTTQASWAPVNETSADLWHERSILVGLFLGAIGYGIHLTLFVWTSHILYTKRMNSKGTVGQFLLLYVVVVFVLGNIGNATNIRFGEMTFIDNRNYPGGPNAFFVQQSTNKVAVLCNSAYIVNSWFQDGLLLYRLWIFSQRSLYTVAFPSIMFLSAVGLSFLLIIELSQPGITRWSKISVNLAIPYWSISIALNVIITLYIATRLLYMRRRLRRVVADCAVEYVSLTAMLVESAALYTINGLVFLVSFSIHSPIQYLALPLLGQTQSISPLLIILRVAQGRAWSDDTMSRLNTMPTQFQVSSRIDTDFSDPNLRGSSTILDSLSFRDISSHDLEAEKGRDSKISS
ncbi:hypothetical protein JR316_0003979 [Psilocybe cubensis]|uniref:Uncharacterized protein n=2 Tax=Psilocybe cubensis TaxID=181762 RepID=A0ACB8HA11_PSICU|nr:hypothetical protein JR316_0003979 [Psilocybe cubensis]KAH9484497.1 hypothetical protein JR316_0003979 [Psilocybe cubensis]